MEEPGRCVGQTLTNHSRIRLKLSGLSPVEYRTQARRA
ncbi:IS3 family transposase [Pseudomonas aeruginosa]